MEILLLSFLSFKALLRIRPYSQSWGLGELRFARVCGSNLVTVLHSTGSDQCCAVSWANRLGILACFLCAAWPVRFVLARLKHQQRQSLVVRPLCRQCGNLVEAGVTVDLETLLDERNHAYVVEEYQASPAHGQCDRGAVRVWVCVSSFMACCVCMSAVDFRIPRTRPCRLSLRRPPVTPAVSRHDLCLASKVLL